MNFEFHTIKAFTQKGLKIIGNPASITHVEEFPSDDTMGRAAKILASPMTTFIKQTEKKNVFEIRHFSPDGDECHVCGHATMAATQYLIETGLVSRQDNSVIFKMNPKFAVSTNHEIVAEINDDNISLTLPAVTELEPISDPEFYKILSIALRVPEDEFEKPAYFAPRVRDIVVAFKNQETMLALEPDFEKLKKMALQGKFIHEGMMTTAKSSIAGFDIANRVFLPGIDVNEDVACGSANCSIIPYWVLKSGLFDDAKRDFNVIYPYPPAGEDYIGGIQKLRLRVDEKEIILTGQALSEKKTSVQVPPKSPEKTGCSRQP